MVKRDKINNEEPKLNFRISQELKDQITTNANRMGTTVSAYMRELLEEVLNEDPGDEAKSTPRAKTIIGSWDFLKLVIWLYRKRESDKITESVEELDFYISVIKRLEGQLPKEVNEEFDKVLANLVVERKGEANRSRSYDFLKSYSAYGTFDYKKMEDYLLTEGQENM